MLPVARVAEVGIALARDPTVTKDASVGDVPISRNYRALGENGSDTQMESLTRYDDRNIRAV